MVVRSQAWHSERWRTQVAHLSASTLEELYAFAARIGLRREWFQDHARWPHYDLMGRMILKADRAGAVACGGREYFRVALCRGKRVLGLGGSGGGDG